MLLKVNPFLILALFLAAIQAKMAKEGNIISSDSIDNPESSVSSQELSMETLGEKLVKAHVKETKVTEDDNFQNFKIQNSSALTDKPILSCKDVLAKNYNSTDSRLTALLEFTSQYCMAERALQITYQTYSAFLTKLQFNPEKKRLFALIKAHLLLVRRNLEQIKALLAPLLLACQEGLSLFEEQDNGIGHMLNETEQKYAQETTVT